MVPGAQVRGTPDPPLRPLENAELAQDEDQQHRAAERDDEACDAAHGREAQQSGDPVAEHRSHHANRHVGDPAHLGVGLHDHARQPADDAANDQSNDQAHVVPPLTIETLRARMPRGQRIPLPAIRMMSSSGLPSLFRSSIETSPEAPLRAGSALRPPSRPPSPSSPVGCACACFLNPPRIAGMSASAPLAAWGSLTPSSRAMDWSPPIWARMRSEEHTSELQSPKDLVCRLLLE